MAIGTSPLDEAPPAETQSRMTFRGHPIHPMLVHFPISYFLGVVATDAAYWWTGEAFWASVSFWLLAAGVAMGTLAALAGTLDFLLVREIRQHVSSWSHFLVAVMMLSMATANWWMRIGDHGGLWPWGALLSVATALAVSAAGVLGGKLVYDHRIAIGDD